MNLKMRKSLRSQGVAMRPQRFGQRRMSRPLRQTLVEVVEELVNPKTCETLDYFEGRRVLLRVSATDGVLPRGLACGERGRGRRRLLPRHGREARADALRRVEAHRRDSGVLRVGERAGDCGAQEVPLRGCLTDGDGRDEGVGCLNREWVMGKRVKGETRHEERDGDGGQEHRVD